MYVHPIVTESTVFQIHLFLSCEIYFMKFDTHLKARDTNDTDAATPPDLNLKVYIFFIFPLLLTDK